MKTALLSLFALAASPLLADPPLLLSWNFDEGSGSHAVNQGSAGDAKLYLLAPGGEAALGFTTGGQGVSGKPGDHAFDLASATGMGATTPNSTGPAGVVWSNSAGLAALSGLSSFTLSGWIKPSSTVTNAARIVASPTITLMAGVNDRLTLQVNGANADEQSQPLYDQANTWIFFAVTYDGTRTTDNVAYYVGHTNAGSLAPAGRTTIAAGKLKPFAGQFLVGNNSSNSATTRPFHGLIDLIEIRGVTDGAAGALSIEKIEAIRAAALR